MISEYIPSYTAGPISAFNDMAKRQIYVADRGWGLFYVLAWIINFGRLIFFVCSVSFNNFKLILPVTQLNGILLLPQIRVNYTVVTKQIFHMHYM